jgi:uncharacterized membrane protein YcaP (DUF421 family)
VLVLIADAAQNAMASSYDSITDGLLLIATLVFWSYAFDWLGYRIPAVQRFVHPNKMPLVKDGKFDRKTMRSELMTEEEVMTQLRLQGVDKLNQVRAAYIEGNGQVSVLKKENASGGDSGGGNRQDGGNPGS